MRKLFVGATLFLTAFGVHPGLANASNSNETEQRTVVWSGAETIDCNIAPEEFTVWELRGADNVSYAELHLGDTPSTVSSLNAAPYRWITERPNPNASVSVQNITGEPSWNTELVAFSCQNETSGWTMALRILITFALGASIIYFFISIFRLYDELLLPRRR